MREKPTFKVGDKFAGVNQYILEIVEIDSTGYLAVPYKVAWESGVEQMSEEELNALRKLN